MIIPSRFSNLKFSLVNVTAIIIDYLMQENKASLSGVLKHLNNFSKEFTRDDVTLSLTFLYALGKIEYIAEYDEVRLANQELSEDVVSA